MLHDGDAFAVGDSFWSSSGLDLFVYETPTPASCPAPTPVKLPRDWGLPPGVPPQPNPTQRTVSTVMHEVVLSPVPAEHSVVVRRQVQRAWRSEAVLDDPSDTLV